MLLTGLWILAFLIGVWCYLAVETVCLDIALNIAALRRTGVWKIG